VGRARGGTRRNDFLKVAESGRGSRCVAWGVGMYGAGTLAHSHTGLGTRCDGMSQGFGELGIARNGEL
jgi:hypothetical protein